MEAHLAEARVVAMVHAHGEALQRIARRFSASHDDAEDAVQRGLEIYLRRLGRVDPATEVGWLKVVVKHEALALRKARREVVTAEPLDPDTEPAADQRSLEELLASRERAGRVAEALRRIKPDEARALLLKAEGLSYQEIGARMDWSYTKTNRCLTEGRKHFHEAYAEIEAGEACDRVAPALGALARGDAAAGQLLELRPHLRNCAACRATVRSLHTRGRARAAALAPVAWLHGVAARVAGADAATGAQVAAAAGGGRVATVAAVAGLCLAAPAAPCLAPDAGRPLRPAPTAQKRPAAEKQATPEAVLTRPRRGAATAPEPASRTELGFEAAPKPRRARRSASEFAALPESAPPRRVARSDEGRREAFGAEPAPAPRPAAGDRREAPQAELGFEVAPHRPPGDA